MRFNFLILSLLACHLLAAQESCDNVLPDANILFEKGLFQRAVDLLEPCLKSGTMSKIQEFNAHRLLALCHIALHSDQEADRHIRSMLAIKPRYLERATSDPGILKNRLSEYQVQYKVSLGVKIYTLNTMANELAHYSLNTATTTYLSQTSLGAGALLNYHLNPKAALVFAPVYSSLRYRKTMLSNSNQEKDYSESVTGLMLPIGLQYNVKLKNLNCYVIGGFQGLNVVHGFAEMQVYETNSPEQLQSSTETTHYRKAWNYGFHYGIGCSSKAGPGIIRISLEQFHFPSNLVVAERRYGNTDFIYRSGYIDSDFNLRSLALGIGFEMPVLFKVKPRK